MNDDVFETIFSFLPVTEAYRLSILSTRFQHSWISCADLNFDSTLYNKLSNDQFKNMVIHILEQHQGNQVRRFRLKLNPDGDEDLVHSWIRKAIPLGGIDELDLDFSQSRRTVKLPAELVLVAATNARIMKLRNCEIETISFESNSLRLHNLHNLREITFNKVEVIFHGSKFLSAILSRCNSLHCMKLIHCNLTCDHQCSHGPPRSIDHLCIDAEHLKDFRCFILVSITPSISLTLNAPSLRSFHYTGCSGCIELSGVAPRWNDVVLNEYYFAAGNFGMKLIQSLDAVRVLTLSITAIKEIRVETWSLSNLKELYVIIDRRLQPFDVLIGNILKRCPRIQRYHSCSLKFARRHWRQFGYSAPLPPSSCASFLSYSTSAASGSDTDKVVELIGEGKDYNDIVIRISFF